MLERAGYRVARRRRCCNKIGHQHKLTKEDAMAWFQRSFEVRFGRTPGDALPRWAVGLRLSRGDARPLACWCSDFIARVAGNYSQQASPVRVTRVRGIPCAAAAARARRTAVMHVSYDACT